MNSIGYAVSGSAGNAGNGNVFLNDINNLPFPFPWERPFLKFPGTGFSYQNGISSSSVFALARVSDGLDGNITGGAERPRARLSSSATFS